MVNFHVTGSASLNYEFLFMFLLFLLFVHLSNNFKHFVSFKVYSWGDNSCGQLGRKKAMALRPKKVKVGFVNFGQYDNFLRYLSDKKVKSMTTFTMVSGLNPGLSVVCLV